MHTGYTQDFRRAAALAATLIALVGAAASDSPLRYDISTGDQLVYERRVRVSSTDGGGALSSHTEQVQLWGLDSVRDETLVLIERLRIKAGGGATVGGMLYVNRRGQRRLPDETLVRVADIDAVLDLLPAQPPAYESQDAWVTPPDHFGRVRRCKRVGRSQEYGGAVRVDFVVEDPTGVDMACGVTKRGSYWFDQTAGHVTRLETEETDSLKHRRIVVVARLHEKREVEAGWRKRRLLESERYLRMLRLEDRLADEIVAEPARVRTIISRAGRLWEELAAEIPRRSHSPFARLARSEYRRSAARLALWRKRAQTSSRWLGAVAAQWSLQTPAGETLRSENLRDRPVLEFFWRSDSPASLRSFAMLRRLRAEAPPEKLRIICLNMDANVFAGRRAIDACGAGLTHVLAGPPIGAEAVTEAPIFRLLDREGRVVAVYFGWQPLLRKKLALAP